MSRMHDVNMHMLLLTLPLMLMLAALCFS